MELAYTATISDDLKTVTIDFEIDVDLTDGSVVDILENVAIEWTEVTATSITFEVDKDSEYLLTFFNNDVMDYESSSLLINSRALLCSNRRNRNDVDNLLKIAKIDNSSRLVDCLNRVVLANHRLYKYTRAAEILRVISNQCEGDCSC